MKTFDKPRTLTIFILGVVLNLTFFLGYIRTGHTQLTFEVLRAFQISDGSPRTDLLEGSDGMLYGVTNNGGALGEGALYRVNRNGSGFTVLHSFQCEPNTDGCNPVSALIEASDGALYGTASTGGEGGAGTIYRLVPDNSAPIASAGGPYSVDEGGTVQLDATASNDPDGDALTYEWDFDYDGVNFDVDATGVTPMFSTNGLDGPHTRTVAVRVSDGALATVATAHLTVQNVAPVVVPVTAPIDPVPVNTAINASASFTDGGTPDTHTAQWNWGDSTTAGTVTQGNGSGSVSDSYVYTTPGVYTLNITVTDDDGGEGSSEFKYVVVYDPNGSFVTGGGWINSPQGAYVADPSLTGKANFGFVSKYKKGANVPTGNTQFQFHAGNLNFHSSTYEWLVVAGARAQFKGTGAINGAGSYGFMLTAIDGQENGGGGADKFRIKIWDYNNFDQIVYDNKLGEEDTSDAATELGGGNVVIHNK